MSSASSPSQLVQVKGSAIANRLAWVKEMYGQNGLRELTGDLSAAGRNLARGEVNPRAWYNYPLWVELCNAIDKRWGPGDVSLNIECGRWGSHHNVPRLYQAFIRLGSVDWVLAKATKLWGEHFNVGQLVVRHEPGAKIAEGEILDFPQPSMALDYSALGFAMGCIELSGGKDVRGEVLAARARGADRDLLRVHWT
jgi:hypothetical protein